MNIDDTYIVTQTAMLPDEKHTADEAATGIAQIITDAGRLSCQQVAKDKPQHRTFALSVSSLVTEEDGKRVLFVTTIVALVPKTVGDVFPWSKPDWVPRSTN